MKLLVLFLLGYLTFSGITVLTLVGSGKLAVATVCLAAALAATEHGIRSMVGVAKS